MCGMHPVMLLPFGLDRLNQFVIIRCLLDLIRFSGGGKEAADAVHLPDSGSLSCRIF